jgi:hypothetical protein
MQPPPRDNKGIVIPHDHAEILNEHFVIRGISIQQISKDTLTGEGRIISSYVFKGSSSKGASMSVNIEKLIIDAGIDPKKFVTDARWIGSIKIKVGDIRSTNCMVGFEPIEAPIPNPYHGGVWGDFNRTTRNALLQASNWFVEIPNVKIAK